MPQTRVQNVVFSVLMAFVMVYGMELYNQALMAGGLTTSLFLTPFADILPLMVAVIVLEHFIGGPWAAHWTFRALNPAEDKAIFIIVARGVFTVSAMSPLMSLVATIVFKQPPLGEFIATWIQTVAMNVPMALLWQLFVAGPVVRAIVRRIPAGSKAQNKVESRERIHA